MRADLCFGGVARVQCGDGDPALRAHCRAFGGGGAVREEEAAAIDGGGTLHQRIGEQREAGGGFLGAVLVDDGVGAAAADFAGTAVGEEREAEPGLVFEAVTLGRVERERDAAFECLGDAGEAVEAGGQRAGGVEGAEAVHGLRERPGGFDQREVSGRECGDGAGVLGVEAVAQGGDLLGRDREWSGGERRYQIGQREVDRGAGDVGGGDHVDGDRDEFLRGGDRVEADQFAADLPGLAGGRELRGAQFQDGTGVAEAQRARVVAHAGGGDPRDLCGNVRPDRQRPLRHRIDEADRVVEAAGLEPHFQTVGEFGERWVDAFVAVEARGFEYAGFQGRGRIGERGEAISEAFGEECGHC